MKINKLSILFLLFSIGTFAQVVPSEVLKLTETIDTTKIKAHVTYLASDALLGRKPGKPGYKMAVDYVIKEYKSMGILPAGENGGYTQKVVLRNSKLVKEKTSLSFAQKDGSFKKLTLGEDYLFYANPEKAKVDFNAPLVFVGSGIDAPELGFNDYKNIDVKGKICVILQKSPDNVPANVKLHLRYPSTYQDYALKHGAIGVLLCNYENNTARFKVGANLSIQGGSTVAIKPDGKLTPSANYMGGNIQVAGSITVDVLKDLMKANGLNLE